MKLSNREEIKGRWKASCQRHYRRKGTMKSEKSQMAIISWSQGFSLKKPVDMEVYYDGGGK